MSLAIEMLELALGHHRAGRLAEAEDLYRKVLEIEPHNGNAWHLLGVLAYQADLHSWSIECIRKSLEEIPDSADAHYNLGNAYSVTGKLDEAIAAYRRAVKLMPGFANAHTNLGNALMKQALVREGGMPPIVVPGVMRVWVG